MLLSLANYSTAQQYGQEHQNKLQLVQNFAARILTGVKKYDHVSPALKELG